VVPDVDTSQPVSLEEERELTERQAEDGIALCLSGGGYRAMVFHLGSLWRLNEAGYLPKLKRVSSVSGGSIIAGALGLAWKRLTFNGAGVATNFEELVVEPVRKVAGTTIDRGSILGGIFTPGSISDKVTAKYDKLLFKGSTLQDLPWDSEGPRFVINATNLQSGVLWRFSKPYMADYKVGRVDNPVFPLARAVAASSAFPPVLSPTVIEVAPDAYTQESKRWELARLQSLGKVYLTDGGVYDNLGLETAYKRYKTLLVSDGGGKLPAVDSVERDWARHSVRVLSVIDGQVRSLRRRQLLDAYERGDRLGTFWSIHSAIASYGLGDPIDVDPKRAQELAATKTRLKKMNRKTQEGLINWGYAISDTAMRRWVDRTLPKPAGLPYPKTKLT
jgi:NTE family protein